MLNARIRNISTRSLHETDRLSKPRPAQQNRKFFEGVAKYLGTLPPQTPIPCLLAHKSDGRSGYNEYIKGATPSDDRLDVYYRTVSGKQLMSLPHPERYLRKEALARNASLHFEASAMLYGKQELGHYYVEAAVAAFVKNGYTNKGPLHLHLRVFGLHSIVVGGEERTPRSPPLALLQEMLVPANGLFSVVPFREYTITMYKGEMLFRDKTGKVVAADHEKFCQSALADTHKDGAEGWVCYVPDEVFDGQAVEDGFGTYRRCAALKVKPEFTGQYLAIKVDQEQEDGDITTLTRLYRKLVPTPASGEDLVYAADVTDHPVLSTYLAGKLPIVSGETGTFKLKSHEVAGNGVQVRVTSANVTANGFLLGVKYYDTSRMPYLDLSQITDTLKMAAGNAHFNSTKQAQVMLKKEMAYLGDEETQVKPCRPRRAKPAATRKITALDEVTEDEDTAVPTPATKLAKLAPLDPLQAEKEAFKQAVDGPRYRVLDPAPVVYVNGKGWLGPMKLFFLRKWIHFLGGNPVNQPGPDVTIVVDHPKSIARLPDPMCVCFDIQRQCHATVRFTTAEDLPALLRNGC